MYTTFAWVVHGDAATYAEIDIAYPSAAAAAWLLLFASTHVCMCFLLLA